MQAFCKLVTSDSVNVSDRAFNYGDGCFTTMKYTKGKIELLDFHLARLQHDADKLRILFGISAELTQYLSSDAFHQSVSQHKESVVKLFLTRGVGGRGYAPLDKQQQHSQCVVSVHPFDSSQADKHLKLGISPVTLAHQPLLAGLKHANRLEQVLAKQALLEHNEELDDAFLLDVNGHIIETISANVFMLYQGHWLTPIIDGAGVNGVMRQFILAKSKALNISIQETYIDISMLDKVESAFCCNALHGIVAIGCIKTQLSINTLDVQTSITLKKALSKHIEEHIS